jgi:hypothetical protein
MSESISDWQSLRMERMVSQVRLVLPEQQVQPVLRVIQVKRVNEVNQVFRA